MAKAAVDGRDRNTSTRTSKKPRASAPSSFINEDDDSSDEIQDDGGDDGEEEGGGATDMRGIIKELQKRKMAKAGTRTNSIQNQKAALYAEARQNAYDAVKDGNDYLDQALDTMHQINCQEGSYKNRLKDILPLYNANDVQISLKFNIYFCPDSFCSRHQFGPSSKRIPLSCKILCPAKLQKLTPLAPC